MFEEEIEALNSIYCLPGECTVVGMYGDFFFFAPDKKASVKDFYVPNVFVLCNFAPLEISGKSHLGSLSTVSSHSVAEFSYSPTGYTPAG